MSTCTTCNQHTILAAKREATRQSDRDDHPGERLWDWIYRMEWERCAVMVEVDRLWAALDNIDHELACCFGADIAPPENPIHHIRRMIATVLAEAQGNHKDGK